MEMLLLKTDRSTLSQVVASRKHATDAVPNIRKGAILLLHKTANGLRPREKPVQFAMEFLRCYPDRNNESRELWGRSWKYILDASRCWELAEPFDISEIQVSGKNYGRGAVKYAYVDPNDAEEIMRRGLLEEISR